MVFVGKDCWNIIAEFGLIAKDLLTLRQTCKYLNGIIKSLNQIWFRHYQWQLCQSKSLANKKKVLSSVRKHVNRFSEYCFFCNSKCPCGHYSPPQYMSYQHAQYVRNQMKTGELTEEHCRERSHWKVIVPQNSNDLPMTGYVSKNLYLFRKTNVF